MLLHYAIICDIIHIYCERGDLMNNLIEIGKRIRLCREKAELTQKELGNALGLNKSTIQRYESGKISRIKLPVLEALAKELGVNPEYLALQSDDPINYEETEEYLNAPLDILDQFPGDAKAVYQAVKAMEDDAYCVSSLKPASSILSTCHLSTNEKRIIELFKELDEIQQENIIAKAELLVEQNKEFKRKEG